MKLDNDSLTTDSIDNQVIGLIVHAYNNHIAAMAGFNELALLQDDQANAKEYLELAINSSKEAVYLGQSLLASASRLQIEMQDIDLAKVKSWFPKSDSTIRFELPKNKVLLTHSNLIWLTDCLKEMIEFLTLLASKAKHQAEITIAVASQVRVNKIILGVFSNVAELEVSHQSQLFMPYYSSKQMFGTKGVGLAKVNGFLKQTKANINWLEGKGFELSFPQVSREES
jgi:hypothetical protein